jgi:hypothetical protein
MMFYLVGPKHCLETVIALSCEAGKSPSDLGDLRESYVSFLRRTQSAIPEEVGPEFGISSYSTGDEKLRPPFGYGLEEPAWGKGETWDLELLKEAHALLVDISSSLGDLFDLVTLWVYSPSAPVRPGSGTLYCGNGLMYVNPAADWEVGDVCETYLHELTHILLSLDEYRFGHYGSYAQMEEERLFAPTAILQRPKPVHLAFHSAVVATEILSLREDLARFGVESELHRPTPKLAATTGESLAAIRELCESEPSLMTPRGQELLEMTERGLREHAGVGLS